MRHRPVRVDGRWDTQPASSAGVAKPAVPRPGTGRFGGACRTSVLPARLTALRAWIAGINLDIVEQLIQAARDYMVAVQEGLPTGTVDQSAPWLLKQAPH